MLPFCFKKIQQYNHFPYTKTTQQQPAKKYSIKRKKSQLGSTIIVFFFIPYKEILAKTYISDTSYFKISREKQYRQKQRQLE